MSDIILTKSNGTTDVTYKLQQNNGSQKIYQNESAGLAEPETLRVQHFLRPAGSKGTDRHQIVLSKAIVEDTSNQYLVLSASLQLSVPRSTEITLSMVKDIIAQLTSYVNLTANVTSLFNGGTPEGDFNVTGPFNPSIA
jgi:hypothetical protein